MEDNIQGAQNSSTSSATASTLTGLLRAEYVCPVCNVTVMSIEGNTLRYSKSHTREVQDDTGEYTSLVMYHPAEGGDFHPGKVLEKPFIAIQSSIITSF